MTTTLTLDDEGRITLPDAIKRAFGIKPGTPLRAEVTAGRIELVKDCLDDVPEVTELTADGLLKIPAGLSLTREEIISAIKADREQRSTKVSGQ
jgi:AbrB family looped-hinge helix DNA binding protein